MTRTELVGNGNRSLAAAAARAIAAIACLLWPFLFAGCAEGNHMVAALGSKSEAYQEYLDDPVTLTTIKTIAILPFDDRSDAAGFDGREFASQLANQLAAQGKVRVIYPKEIMDAVERENRSARRHNALLKERMSLGLYVPDEKVDKEGIFTADTSSDEMRPRRYYNPIKNLDEAVRLARMAKADAIIVGEASDFDPYMRPRLSLTMRVVATGNSDTAAQAIAELTQWGIPRPTTAARGTIYLRQENFDSSIGSVGLEVSKHGRTHYTDDRAFGTEIYIRSMSHFYEVVARSLAKSYVDARKKAIKEAEDRARQQAKTMNADQEAAVKRISAMIERDSRIPDFETDQQGEAWFDQAFADKQGLLQANGGDKRIQSWRADGRSRTPTPEERRTRDARIPENERGPGLEGYSAMVDAGFPDADAFMESNMGDSRDKSWRPDYYNHANPQKAAPMYRKQEFYGNK